ncbi:cytochrome c [Aliisedimentitalea scapharcae]|uniref:Cytochrome c n=1 Tax=Aliisedimentitalea scapharcae TaxID=1524259 RepID=A0ABZ2XTD5_9RHOB
MNPKIITLGICAGAAVAAFVFLKTGAPEHTAAIPVVAGDAMVAVQIPPLEGTAAIGQSIFENTCAACHGENAAGIQNVAPPLVHIIYEPGHHGDEAFQRAVAGGVKSHHWQFGDMPPVVGLTRGDVAMVIDYVRALQRANGIE